MRVPLRLRHQSPATKLAVAFGIAIAISALAIGARNLWPFSVPLSRLDDLLYDSLYRLRPQEDRSKGPVVLIAVDQYSLDQLANPGPRKKGFGWPWPRSVWAYIVDYLRHSGARVIVFDLLFTEPSAFGDDSIFAKSINDSPIPPIVFAAKVSPDGHASELAVPIKQPIYGATNIGKEVVYRQYEPLVDGFASLAVRAVEVAGMTAPPIPREPFLLHYFGPYQRGDGRTTFRYLPAINVLGAARHAPNSGVSPEMFDGKIVLIGAVAAGTYDVKSSPVSGFMPGMEVHATAIEDILGNRRVIPLRASLAALIALLASLAAALLVILPRRVVLKLAGAILVAALLLALAASLFLGHQIRWLPLAAPLLALLLATIAAFAWSYFAEDRQRQIVLKALSQYVSPEIAAQVAKDPDSLRLGGDEREMTVMFTDIQGFTDLSERLEVGRLTNLLNYYLGEMSSLVRIGFNGTLDKYIGDAIMSFWNAPVNQPDHAILACRAALAMSKREEEIQPELIKLGAESLLTRIGINSGVMKVGNMGSPVKFNYSVLGDPVNLGSRLESANKFYGSRILISQNTANHLNGQFVLRKLDVLQVKGKQQPMAVYELMAEGSPDDELRVRVSEYEAAFELYQKQRWDEAEGHLEVLRQRFRKDHPPVALAERIAHLRQHPPGADWNGVYVAKGK